MVIVHWPECNNAPCTCGERGDLLLTSDANLAPIRGLHIAAIYDGGSFGDCVSCDGYILTESEAPHCPTCARLIREGKPL